MYGWEEPVDGDAFYIRGGEGDSGTDSDGSGRSVKPGSKHIQKLRLGLGKWGFGEVIPEDGDETDRVTHMMAETVGVAG